VQDTNRWVATKTDLCSSDEHAIMPVQERLRLSSDAARGDVDCFAQSSSERVTSTPPTIPDDTL
jgi:hypothetical protein